MVMSNKHEVLLEARGVSLALQGKLILDRVDLTVRRGEIVTLIGPNGAGKSTLVRVVLGLMKQDQGSVKISPGTRIGYMPQRLTIDPVLPLTVRRFLTLAARAPERKMLEVLQETGAAHLLDSAMQTLSGGETQRVLLARAMLRDPDLLILDEPVQGVDVNGQEELYRLISNIRTRHHCGILMISHDLHLVMSSTDQVLCLNRHVCCSGHPDTVRVDPSYVALFGRMPVLTPYSHHHDHSHDVHGNVVSDDDEHKGCNHG
jgi:zinc transport system ATP-binding protein